MHSDKGLSAWQLAMMALGTVIGGAFFLGSAVGIQAAGPGIVLSYLLGGAIAYVILYALSEMTVADPAPGSFRTFAQQAYGRGVGFVVGWVYWTGLVLAMSSEATAVSIFLKSWFPGLPLGLLGSAVIVAVTLLNLLGADRLSKLESGLAAVKILAIAGFIAIGLFMISGLFPGISPIGMGAAAAEPLLPSGVSGIAGSMLVVIFAYAGLEMIGLAASEAKDPHRTIPKAIKVTITSVVSLYVLAVLVLLPLIPTGLIGTEHSPLVLALTYHNLTWASNAINVVLVTAILSTMLAAMFGLGRMIRSLAAEGHAPVWLKDCGDIPYRGILFSGAGMLMGLGFGSLLPQVYLFLVSAGGFALLSAYVVILATHYKYRKLHGCPPQGNCQLPWFPYSSGLALAASILIIASMPLVPGQGMGLAAGLILIALFSLVYYFSARPKDVKIKTPRKSPTLRYLEAQYEIAEELTMEKEKKER